MKYQPANWISKNVIKKKSFFFSPLSDLVFDVFKEIIAELITETVGSYLGFNSTRRTGNFGCKVFIKNTKLDWIDLKIMKRLLGQSGFYGHCSVGKMTGKMRRIGTIWKQLSIIELSSWPSYSSNELSLHVSIDLHDDLMSPS